MTDTRQWKLISDYLGNDCYTPYSTAQLFEYAAESNAANAGDEDWIPFDLRDVGDRILDLSHQRGNEGFIAAIPWEDLA